MRYFKSFPKCDRFFYSETLNNEYIGRNFVSAYLGKGLYTLDIFTHDIAIKRYCNKKMVLSNGF